MSNVPPPTDALVELAAVLGEDNVRTLVRTFLRDFPVSLRDLNGGDRKQRHRVAHSMKSNSRLMGAMNLSERLAALENRLESGGDDVSAADIAALTEEYETVAAPLRLFVGSP
jgi:HPt (histidine-containing phosphotransfer) domain-containing protein